MTDFDSSIARARNLEVDVEHLDSIGTYLTTIAEAMDTIRERSLLQAHLASRTGGDGSQSALGAEQIGEILRELTTRETTTYEAIKGGLKAIADDLEKAAEGIAEMARTYDTVEERNALTAAQWTEAISG